MMLEVRKGVAAARNRFAAKLGSYRRDERGAIIVLTLFLFVAMLLVTGIAIDVVRTEYARTKLAGTLDRALLAAADKENRRDPEDVVLSYFEKAGLGAYISREMIAVEDDETFAADGSRDITYRAVAAMTSANVPTLFLNRVGIDTLPAPASGRADEGSSPVEIVVVVDVSGSMVQNSDMQVGQEDAQGNPILDSDGNQVFVQSTRLVSLQSAARRFVNTIYARPENQNRVAMAIVPYAWNVNHHLARDIYGKTTGAADTGCLVFSDTDYQTEQVLPGSDWAREPHADSFSYYNRNWASSAATTSPQDSSYSWNCPQTSYVSGSNTVQTGHYVLPHTNEPNRLISFINNLTGGGSTSVEVGMKWGVHMIDPSYRPVNQAMIAAGHTDAQFFQVPNEYGYVGTRKYIILMTDGQNMPSYELNPQFRDGLSPIFEGIYNGGRVYSFFDPTRSSNRYYRARTGSWASTADRNSGTPVQLTWEEVWDRLTVSYVAYHLYAKRLNPSNPWQSYNEIYRNVHGNYAMEIASTGDSSTMITRQNSSMKDTRLKNICDSVRDNPLVTVFSIAFRPDAEPVLSDADAASASLGDRALATCASTYAHYYAAPTGQRLQSAFDSIATQILDLRLTQ